MYQFLFNNFNDMLLAVLSCD